MEESIILTHINKYDELLHPYRLNYDIDMPYQTIRIYLYDIFSHDCILIDSHIEDYHDEIMLLLKSIMIELNFKESQRLLDNFENYLLDVQISFELEENFEGCHNIKELLIKIID